MSVRCSWLGCAWTEVPACQTATRMRKQRFMGMRGESSEAISTASLIHPFIAASSRKVHFNFERTCTAQTPVAYFRKLGVGES